MISPGLERLLAQVGRTQRVLWLALTAAIAIYVVVAFAMAGDREPAALPPAVEWGAWGVAAALAAAAALVVRRSHDPERLRVEIERTDPAAPAPPMLAAAVGDLEPREQRLAGAVARLFQPWILGMVLSESVAIVGLVLALVFADGWRSLPPALLAGVLNATFFPRPEQLARRALGWTG